MKMSPPRSSSSYKQSKGSQGRAGKQSDRKNPAASHPRREAQDQQRHQLLEDRNQIEVSDTIPIALQQLLLNVFRTALLTPSNSLNFEAQTQGQDQNLDAEEKQEEKEEEPLDTKSLIQTIKSHLYNRDFDSAFADADEKLLRAYALRWSAARALGYAGLFKSLFKILSEDESVLRLTHVVCIGGGAGAEIVALAAAWRDLMDDGVIAGAQKRLPDALEAVALDDRKDNQGGGGTSNMPSQEQTVQQSDTSSSLSITAVDIADWSTVVKRLSSTILSTTVIGSKSHPAPLLPISTPPGDRTHSSHFTVYFKRFDVLTLSDPDLASLFHSQRTNIVTLMFTLNELFSTSMSKATSFLLRTTDLLARGTILLVVDSPGSYSTLKLNKSTGEQQERQYPMKFLLDHTLLSVTKGKWEKLYSQDSRWWRRDASRLWYDVGEGAGLEDMRFQIHVYRRLE
ncbi:25S rRNA (uracil2843-N3)-methyltransferase [Aspergillus foveolatus]|uniref:25S rRNA (uracil2843-N3)-methyltransferase n=1 Tax=Aspergillus foveolatus TaxID=210207 RepID=UPI003CCE47B2